MRFDAVAQSRSLDPFSHQRGVGFEAASGENAEFLDQLFAFDNPNFDLGGVAAAILAVAAAVAKRFLVGRDIGVQIGQKVGFQTVALEQIEIGRELGGNGVGGVDPVLIAAVVRQAKQVAHFGFFVLDGLRNLAISISMRYSFGS